MKLIKKKKKNDDTICQKILNGFTILATHKYYEILWVKLTRKLTKTINNSDVFLKTLHNGKREKSIFIISMNK